jgi:hypothetical protein
MHPTMIAINASTSNLPTSRRERDAPERGIIPGSNCALKRDEVTAAPNNLSVVRRMVVTSSVVSMCRLNAQLNFTV